MNKTTFFKTVFCIIFAQATYATQVEFENYQTTILPYPEQLTQFTNQVHESLKESASSFYSQLAECNNVDDLIQYALLCQEEAKDAYVKEAEQLMQNSPEEIKEVGINLLRSFNRATKITLYEFSDESVAHPWLTQIKKIIDHYDCDETTYKIEFSQSEPGDILAEIYIVPHEPERDVAMQYLTCSLKQHGLEPHTPDLDFLIARSIVQLASGQIAQTAYAQELNMLFKPDEKIFDLFNDWQRKQEFVADLLPLHSQFLKVTEKDRKNYIDQAKRFLALHVYLDEVNLNMHNLKSNLGKALDTENKFSRYPSYAARLAWMFKAEELLHLH